MYVDMFVYLKHNVASLCNWCPGTYVTNDFKLSMEVIETSFYELMLNKPHFTNLCETDKPTYFNGVNINDHTVRIVTLRRLLKVT